MISYVTVPNLPQGRVTTALCGADFVSDYLEKIGIEVIRLNPSKRLHPSLSSHADMLCFHIGGESIISTDDIVYSDRVRVIYSSKALNDKYPDDVLFNCALIGDILVANPRTAAPEILDFAQKTGKTIVSVRQGYTKCSIAIVSERAAITSDRVIAEKLSARGIDVLKIGEGNIRLDGMSHGFIGGACAKLSCDSLLFAGDVLTHPDGERICSFAERYGCRCISMMDGELIDFGGFIPLVEEI